jgi:hypothetical protein
MEDTTPSETPPAAGPRADHLWIAVRFFGLFMLFLATQHLVNVVGNSLTIVVTAVSLPSSEVSLPIQLVISSAIRLVLFAAVGTYLLRDGDLVFRGLGRLSSVPSRTV